MSSTRHPLIRPVSLADAEACRAVVDAVAREGRWLMAVEGFTVEATREFIRGNLEGGNIHVVAALDRDVVGWCDIVRAWPFDGFRDNGRLGMGLLAGWRGQGLGRALASTAVQRAWDCGFRRIELEAFATNTPALGLYRALGFVEEGRKRAVRLRHGVVEDLVCMGLLRDEAAQA
ncbi:MAG: N-acetyltransferase family protein [Limisphaerales bacterium]